MAKRILMMAAAVALFCSCAKVDYWGSFEVINYSSKTIHVESTFDSADGNGCHSADIEPRHGRCQLCRSLASSASRDFIFEDIVTNPSEGKVTVSCEDKVVLEWTFDMKDYLSKSNFMSSTRKGMFSKMEYGINYSLSFGEDMDGNIVADGTPHTQL